MLWPSTAARQPRGSSTSRCANGSSCWARSPTTPPPPSRKSIRAAAACGPFLLGMILKNILSKTSIGGLGEMLCLVQKNFLSKTSGVVYRNTWYLLGLVGVLSTTTPTWRFCWYLFIDTITTENGRNKKCEELMVMCLDYTKICLLDEKLPRTTPRNFVCQRPLFSTFSEQFLSPPSCSIATRR